MKSHNIYQHYIPQCYLRQFSPDDKNKRFLYAYSKRNSKSFKIAISKVCGINNFYGLSDEYLAKDSEQELNRLSLESDFFGRNIEPEWGSLLRQIDERKCLCLAENCNDFGVTVEEKRLIAKQIVIQYMRLPEVRKAVNGFSDELLQKHIRLFKEGLAIQMNNPDIAKMDIEGTFDEVVNHASCTFIDDDMVKEYSEVLSRNYWFFHYSPTKSFFTSDSPIFAFGHADNKCDVRNENMGLTRLGVELTFPLSPSLLVAIWDYRYFGKYKDFDGCFGKVTDDYLKRCNITRFCQAKEYVFSYNDNFSF